MNYHTKYLKYKKKYLKAKYYQFGGDISNVFLIYEDNIFKPKKITHNTDKYPLIESINTPIIVLNHLTKFFRDQNFDEAETNINKDIYVIKKGNYELNVYLENQNIITSVLKFNNQIQEKIFYLALQELNLKLRLKEFIQDDITYSTGNCEFEFNNNEITIIGNCTLEKKGAYKRQRFIESIIIKKIICNNEIIYLDINVDTYKDLLKQFQKRTVLASYEEFKNCKETNKIRYEGITDNPTLKESVLTTICGKIYYLLTPETRNILNEYENITKLLVKNDLTKIKNTFDFTNIKSHMKTLPKYLPSTIRNDHFEIIDSTDSYVTLPNNFKIIFDSGNDSVTMIGKDIVNHLGLQTFKGCVMTTSGIGGQATNCGEYVELKFKFSREFMIETEDYSLLAFVDDSNLKNTLLFGHSSGLDLLFKDNYSINSQYDDPEIIKQQKKLSELSRDNKRQLFHILKTYNSDPGNYAPLMHATVINAEIINRYDSSISSSELKTLFQELETAEQNINRINDVELKEKLLGIIQKFKKYK